MSEYIGPTNIKIKQLTKERDRQLQRFEEERNKIQNESHRVSGISNKFASNKGLTAEEQLKNETVGLVTLEDFTKKQQSKLEADLLSSDKNKENNKKKTKKRKRELNKNVLSFQEELEQEQQSILSIEENKKQKLEKDPTVYTLLLPDREREEMEQKQREYLQKQWLEEQERIKQEEIEITYSYWDGTGHRKTHKCKKGTTIESFLYTIQPEWKELKRVSVGDLMFVKEDVIIPHHYSFYDLIISKARGISGPLFLFDVKDDIRLVSDATIETEESHAAKVVERRWYEQNKNKFPVCRWEVYSPDKKDYSQKYTIKGSANTSTRK